MITLDVVGRGYLELDVDRDGDVRFDDGDRTFWLPARQAEELRDWLIQQFPLEHDE